MATAESNVVIMIAMIINVMARDIYMDIEYSYIYRRGIVTLDCIL
jgi:hypothetical protein